MKSKSHKQSGLLDRKNFLVITLPLIFLLAACGDDQVSSLLRLDGAIWPNNGLGLIDGRANPSTDPGPAGDGPILSGPDGANSDAGLARSDSQGGTAPAHSLCQNAKVLSFSGSSLQIQDSTAYAPDEFASVDCGNDSGPWAGGQLYYRVSLKANKKYKAELLSNFDAALYAFPANTACAAKSINSACATPSAADPYNSFNSDRSSTHSVPEVVFINPAQDADWIFVVDSYAAPNYGLFTLRLEEFVPPANAACAQPQVLTPPTPGNKLQITGNTTGAVNEFGLNIKCGTTYDHLEGPQVYYQMNFTAGQGYKLTLTPNFTAHLYLFPASAQCQSSAVEGGCASRGQSGDLLGAIDIGTAKTLYFKPLQSGDYLIAIDGRAPWLFGNFELTIEQYTEPANTHCSAAQALTWNNNVIKTSGTTGGAVDEFPSLHCGSTQYFSGPQAYFTVDLTGGTIYRLLLSASFRATAYLANTSAGCVAEEIEKACSSSGNGAKLSGLTEAGKTRSLYFTPSATGKYFLVVDSGDRQENGDFSLELTPLPTASNGSCSQPAPIDLSGAGQASLAGDTYGLPNQCLNVKCGLSSAFLGPQAFYSFTGQAGLAYQIKTTTTFNGTVYIFRGSDNCSCSLMELDCTSGGQTGAFSGIITPGGTSNIVFHPPQTGTYLIAVDSLADTAGYFGFFNLDLKVLTPPAHSHCASPKILNFNQSPLVENGDTTGAANEFANSIKCGTDYDFDGPQVYYQLPLHGGVKYTIELTSPSFNGAIYLFRDQTCGFAKISQECGQSGMASDNADVTGHEKIVITPSSDGNYLLAVDSYLPTHQGPFTLSITW